MPRKTERLEFSGSLGATLVGRMEHPAGDAKAYALFAHCFTCSKDLKSIGAISRTLAERGYGVFRFDFTGLGESAGDFADTNFSSNLDDLVAAADFLSSAYRPPQLLIGHSLGGAAVLAAARRITASAAVATIAAPSSTQDLRGILLDRVPDIADEGKATVELGGQTFTIKKQLLEDLAEEHVQKSLAHLQRAFIIFHSPADRVVSIEHARRLFQAAKHPKSFVSLDGADHLLSNTRDARFVGEMLAVWADRYVDMD